MARPERYPIKKVIGFDQETMDAIEGFRRDAEQIPNVSEAIRDILRAWLQENGYLKTEIGDGRGDATHP